MDMYEIFKAEYGKNRVIYSGSFTDKRPNSGTSLTHAYKSALFMASLSLTYNLKKLPS